MDNVNPDLRLLRCFLALMDERSVSLAAARLDLSQPAMSHALARLRRAFDDPLLLKGRSSMTPTARAIELQASVKALLDAAARLTQRPLPFDAGTARTRYTVMAPEYVEYLLAPPLVARLREESPGADIEFRTSNPEHALEQLDSGELDFRIGWWPKPAAMLRAKLLFRDRIVCLARKAHPLLRGTITTEQFLQALHVRIQTPRTGVSIQAIDRAVGAQRRSLRVALQVQNAFSVAHVVSGSDLIASVTERMARKLAAQYPLQILTLPLNVPDVRMVLYWHERTHAQSAHRWFRQLLADAVKSL